MDPPLAIAPIHITVRHGHRTWYRRLL